MHVIAEAELPGSADRVLVDLLSMTQAEPGYNNPMDRDLVAGHSTCTFCEQILSTQLASKVSDSSSGLGDAFPAYLCRWISTSFSSTAPDVLDVYIAKVCEWANLITWAQIDCCQDVDDLKHLLFANLQNMISKSCTTNSFRVHLTQQPHRLVPSKHSDGVQVLAWLPSSRDVAQNVALSTPTLPLHDPSLSSFCDISDRQGPGPASYRHWARLQLHWLGAARRVLGHALSYTLEMHQHGGGGAPAAEDPDEEAPTLASHLEEWLSDLLACPAAAAELQATLLPEAFLQDLGEALLESEGPRPSEEVVHRARELWAAQWLAVQMAALADGQRPGGGAPAEEGPAPFSTVPSPSRGGGFRARCQARARGLGALLLAQHGDCPAALAAAQATLAAEVDLACLLLRCLAHLSPATAAALPEPFEAAVEAAVAGLLGPGTGGDLDALAAKVLAGGAAGAAAAASPGGPPAWAGSGAAEEIARRAVLALVACQVAEGGHCGLLPAGGREEECAAPGGRGGSGAAEEALAGLLGAFGLPSPAAARLVLAEPAAGVRAALWAGRRAFFWAAEKGRGPAAARLHQLPAALKALAVSFL